jgi:hypothetical protein
MNLPESVPSHENVATGFVASAHLDEPVMLRRAKVTVQQRRPSRWLDAVTPDPTSYVDYLEPAESLNQITNAGRDFLHSQGYNTSGLGANGLNYIALTNTAVTPAAGDTTLSGEIVANGLSRTQGVYAHTTGTNTTTITNTFTCATAPQAAQAAALFTASSAGTMNHELTFTQRSLQIGDQLVCTFTITLG